MARGRTFWSRRSDNRGVNKIQRALIAGTVSAVSLVPGAKAQQTSGPMFPGIPASQNQQFVDGLANALKAKGQIDQPTFDRWRSGGVSEAEAAIITQNTGGYYANGRVMMNDGLMHVPAMIVEGIGAAMVSRTAGTPGGVLPPVCDPQNQPAGVRRETDQASFSGVMEHAAEDAAKGGAGLFLLVGLVSSFFKSRGKKFHDAWIGAKVGMLGGALFGGAYEYKYGTNTVGQAKLEAERAQACPAPIAQPASLKPSAAEPQNPYNIPTMTYDTRQGAVVVLPPGSTGAVVVPSNPSGQQ